jgi:hypothetical protein
LKPIEQFERAETGRASESADARRKKKESIHSKLNSETKGLLPLVLSSNLSTSWWHSRVGA